MKDGTSIIFYLASLLCAHVQQFGSQAGGAKCPGSLCCSKYGYCGSTDPYCGPGCQNQYSGGLRPTPTPTPPGGGGAVASLISSDQFEQMLKHGNDANCPARGFYTYDAFIAAANSFNGFAEVGNTDTRKREIAAFLGQTSHETTGVGPLHQMSHMHVDTALKRSKAILAIIVNLVQSTGPALPGRSTMGEGLCKFHSTTIMGLVEEPLETYLMSHPGPESPWFRVIPEVRHTYFRDDIPVLSQI